MQRCKACGSLKAYAEFYYNPTRGIGLDAFCKECSNQKRQQRRKRAKVRKFLAEGDAWKRSHPERFH